MSDHSIHTGQSPAVPLRCAIYIRVSTSEQKMHGKSLSAQKEYLLSYAKAHQMEVAGIYADEGQTARKELRKRKAVHALLQDARDGRLDLILFWKMDRWFRNISDFYKVQEQLDACHVRWIAAAEPNINMDTREGRLNLNIMLSIGQNEVDTTSERIRFTAQHMIRSGRLIFGQGNMPFGYMAQRDGQEKRMVQNPEEKPIVEDIFRYYFRHPCKKDTLDYILRTYGLSFSYTRLNTMLTSEFYKGTYRGFPYCPAYLSARKWERLQTLAARRPDHTSKSGRIYLFSGLIRCPACGRPLSGTGCGRYCYYRCHAYPNDCSFRGRASQSAVEEDLTAYLASLDPPFITAIYEFCFRFLPKDTFSEHSPLPGRPPLPELLRLIDLPLRKSLWAGLLQDIFLSLDGDFAGLRFQPHLGLTRQ